MAKKQSQKLFFEFLQEAEKSGKKFSKEELISAIGWKPSTFKTYFDKGQITQFVSEVNQNQFEAINCLDINFVEFKKRLSQSKHYQDFGHNCNSNLPQALLN